MDVERQALLESFLRNYESLVDYFQNTDPAELTRASTKAYLSHIFKDVSNEFKFFVYIFMTGEPELQSEFHKTGLTDRDISDILNFKRRQQRFATKLVSYYFEEEGCLNALSGIRYRTNYNVKNNIPYITLSFSGFGEEKLVVTQEAANISQIASGIVESVVEAYRRIKKLNLPVDPKQLEVERMNVGRLLKLANELQDLLDGSGN